MPSANSSSRNNNKTSRDDSSSNKKASSSSSSRRRRKDDRQDDDEDAKAKERARRDRTINNNNRVRSRQHRNNSDEDAKAKERGRRSTAIIRPGAQSVASTDVVYNNNGKKEAAAASRKGRRDDDRSIISKNRRRRRDDDDKEAKLRAKGSRSNKTDDGQSNNNKPGVSYERSSTSASRKKAQDGGGAGSSSVRSSNSRTNRTTHRHSTTTSRKGDDNNKGKKGYKNSGALTPGVQAERTDRGRTNKKMKEYDDGYNVVASNQVLLGGEEEEVPLAAMVVDEDDEDALKKEQEAARMKKRAQEEADRVAREREEEEERRRQLEEQERIVQEMKRKKRQRQKIWCAVVILVLCGGDGAVAYFATQGGGGGGGGGAIDITTTPTDNVTDVDNPLDTNTTLSPAIAQFQSPSSNPSSSPTVFVKYPPPDQEECQRLANGLPPLDPDDTMEVRNFDVDVDLGLSSADTDIASVLPEVQQTIQEWLVPPLVGCSVQRRFLKDETNNTAEDSDNHSLTRTAAMRQLQTSLANIRYMIASVEVTIIDQGQDCAITSSSAPKCGLVRITLIVRLRGDERNFNVVVLLSDFFPTDEDLKDVIGFSDVVDTFITRAIRATSPTTPPSNMPSEKPSLVPTALPTTAASSNPTFKPVDDALITKVPTKAPTKAPTLPDATPSPTKTASATPTLAPTPTPPPTLPDATASPTKTASSNPTNTPSRSPSKTPSQVPTITSSLVPSAQPSKVPTESPTLGPTSSPTSEPSANPTTTPPTLACGGNTVVSYDGSTLAGNDNNNNNGGIFAVDLGFGSFRWTQSPGESSTWNLGVFTGHADLYTWEYDNGDDCEGNGPRRGTVHLQFVADASSSYATFSNPSTCVYRLDLYISSSTCELPASIPTPAPTPLPTPAPTPDLPPLINELYCGCLAEPYPTRTFPFKVRDWVTQAQCLQECSNRGYKYWAMQFNYECRCSNDTTGGIISDNCDMKCFASGSNCYGDIKTSDSSCTCGSGWVNSVFRTSKDYPCPEAALLRNDYATATFNYQQAYPASNAIDGNEATFAESAIPIPPLPEWLVDLGIYASITKITVANRQDCCQERMEGVKLEILDVNQNVISGSERTLTLGSAGSLMTEDLTFSAGISGARFIRLTGASSAYPMNFAEIEAYGVAHEGATVPLTNELYCGCHTEINPRTFGVYIGDWRTPINCLQICTNSGYNFAGLQFSYQCFCSNSAGVGTVPSNQCLQKCPYTYSNCIGNVQTSDGSCTCGNGWVNTIFRTNTNVACPESHLLRNDFATATLNMPSPMPASVAIDGNLGSYTENSVPTATNILPVFLVDLGVYAAVVSRTNGRCQVGDFGR